MQRNVSVDPLKGYATILDRFCVWAETQDNIRAAIVIGSRARTEHPADAWSDLDLLILARDPDTLWDEDTWCGEMGDVWLSFREPTPDGAFERRVLYAGGLDVDYAPTAVAQGWRMIREGPSPFAASLLQPGYRVIVDKDGLGPHLDAMTFQARCSTLPDAQAYDNLVADVLFHVVWTAKKLLRGDLWSAKSCCDGYLKGRMLTLLTWHTLATRQGSEPWVAGRRMAEWADPRALESLPATFGQFDKNDLWRALHATADLARWLAQEIAPAIGTQYPASADLEVRDWLSRHEPGSTSVPEKEI